MWNIGTMERAQREYTMDKKRRVQAQLDKTTSEKLLAVEKARGVNESEAIRLCIANAVIVSLGDARQLSQEFCKIRIALEKENIDREVKEEVMQTCQYISDVLREAENLAKSLNG